MTGLDVLLNKKAKRWGLSHRAFGSALKAMRITASPGAYLSRKRGAQALLANSPWAGYIAKEEGFRKFAPDELPGLEELVRVAQGIYQERHGSATEGSMHKAFFANILGPEDLQAHPEIMDFVLSDGVVEAVMAYLGAVPRLMGVGLYVSPPNDSLKSSQLFHFDGDDFRQVKCFINLVAINEDNGPFTFYGARASARVQARLGRPWGAHRYDDESIADVCRGEAAHLLTGGPGHGAFVDTARCVHFGSRTRRTTRAVLMFHFVRVPDLKISKDRSLSDGRPIFDFACDRYQGDWLRRMILSPKN